MNCRIVGAICQHNFAQTQTVLVSFQRKKSSLFWKKWNDSYINYFIHPCPCFHLTLNKIPPNKTKNALDVWPRWTWRITSENAIPSCISWTLCLPRHFESGEGPGEQNVAKYYKKRRSPEKNQLRNEPFHFWRNGWESYQAFGEEEISRTVKNEKQYLANWWKKKACTSLWLESYPTVFSVITGWLTVA